MNIVQFSINVPNQCKNCTLFINMKFIKSTNSIFSKLFNNNKGRICFLKKHLNKTVCGSQKIFTLFII